MLDGATVELGTLFGDIMTRTVRILPHPTQSSSHEVHDGYMERTTVSTEAPFWNSYLAEL